MGEYHLNALKEPSSRRRPVTPAEAGAQPSWIPAFAGMTRLAGVTVVFVLLGTCAVSSARADAGRTSGLLLKEPFGARPFAMGQAYAALGDDIFGMNYNPASLSRMKESQTAAQGVQSISDAQLGYLGIASPLNPYQALGLSVKYLDLGKGDIFDSSGNSVRTVSAERDFLVHLGYAHSFAAPGGKLHLGAGAKYLNSVIADEVRGSAYAADVGAIYEWPWASGLASAGLAASNAGPGIKYSGGIASGSENNPLPLTTRLAFGYSKAIFNADALAGGAELDQVAYDNSRFESVGVEYDYHRVCAFRLGYRAGQDSGGLSMGLGLRLKNMSIDYGLGLMQSLGNVQQLAVNYRFTIPGIRYTEAPLPSPLETLEKNVEKAVAEKRYFDAAGEVERIRTFFPEASASATYSKQIEDEIRAMIVPGVGAPRYAYALGFNRYQQKNWEEAVPNLEAALRSDPDNREIRRVLAIARQNLADQRRQLKLQTQARTGTLFELANLAFEERNYGKAEEILREILSLGPYEPAESLQNRIDAARRAPRPAPPVRKPVTAPVPAPPSAADTAKADDLFKMALRVYREGRPDSAADYLREARRLNPDSTLIRNFLESVEKELREKAGTNR